MSTQTTLEITEDVTDVSVTGDTLEVSITDDVTVVEAYTLAVPFEVPGQITANNVTVVPHNTISSTNLQTVLEGLADQFFRSDSTPTGSNLAEGDLWYDTDDDQLKVYRETSTGNFSFVPVMVGNISTDSDTIDAGSY